MRNLSLILLLATALVIPAGNAKAQQEPETDHPDHAHETDDSVVDEMLDDDAATDWTCPMHPQISRDGPGSCPICGMDLVERQRDEDDATTVTVPPGIQQAMNLRTAEVRRDRLWRRIDTIGRVQVDESNLQHLHPRVEGWIEELDIDAAGDPVEAGQRLFTLYSPELVNVQEEHLQAVRSGRQDMIRATRQRLEVLDVQSSVIERIEKRGEPMIYLPWYARKDGYVVDLNVRHGMHVTPGMEMLSMADPTTVWLIADVFAGQIDWLAEGQSVDIDLQSAPGQTRRGQIDFIHPELAGETRTARVRIVLDNEDGKLRPGDWASLSIYGGAREDLLIVPTEALIRTGHETRVVVQDDESRFSVRQVRAGMESGRFTEIVEGLEQGERVVVSGQFLIDSEANRSAGAQRLGGQHDH
ncbi:MAG: efflux RND transporter periplasmic adaptor subunit [Wenzhouxiangella sp.]